MDKYDHLEISRIIGEPKDPRRPYPDLVSAVCEVDSADPNEYVYYFDVIFDTDYVISTIASGTTTTNVTPYTPTLLTFLDIATNEYYIKITDLAISKERVLARKKVTINRSLNAIENQKVVSLLDAAAIARGNLNDLRSGETSFNYRYVVDMIDQIIDYSENYVLVVGTAIDKDIKLMDWKDSYESLTPATVISAFHYIGETPRSELREDNTEATCESRESVTTTRETSNFMLDEDMVCSTGQLVEVSRND